ncbi:MAG TPA: MFS transporter [Acetobacteraceae bacterium]|nr:MFS transporter [Acetobacteraceae bacterium]
MDTRSDPSGILLARLDRIPVWALPRLFAGVIGVGFLFTFYDIFDINVSFIETCSQLVPGCTPQNAANAIGLPVLLNLLGYVIGTLVLSPLADRLGRRDLLLVTMVLTGIGSALTAIVGNYAWFVIARLITGVGVGADLAIVNTYIGEMAPRAGRARYTAMIFIFSALGAMLGIWVGLWLTTPPARLPFGLPFALASPAFGQGWRLMYAIGALLALVGVLLRFQLPESPRWLIARGRFDEAEIVITEMEARARAIAPLGSVPAFMPPPLADELPFRAILRNPVYLRRTILLFCMWFLAYVTLYSFGAGFTTLLAALGYPPPEAGMITAMGTFGFLLCAVVAYGFGEQLERKSWMPLSAAITLLGGILVALTGSIVLLGILGAIIIFFGFNLWVPIAYAWSIENYPTRARTTGFALVDGIGHLGGGIGLFVIAPLIPRLGVLAAMMLIIAFLVLAAIIAQFGVGTRDLRLEEISP